MAIIFPFPVNPNSCFQQHAYASETERVAAEARHTKAMIGLTENLKEVQDVLLATLLELELAKQSIASCVNAKRLGFTSGTT